MNDDVFKKVRIKISLMTLVLLAVFLFLLIGAFNLYLEFSNRHSAVVVLRELVENNGFMRKPRSRGESSDSHSSHLFTLAQDTRSVLWLRLALSGYRNFCTMRLESDGSIRKIINPFYDPLDLIDETELVKTIFAQNKPSGFVQDYLWRLEPRGDGFLLAMIDRSAELQQQRRFGIVSVLLYLFNLLVAFVFARIFSAWSVMPLREAFARQKQFVADAGHELKTPIAVIGANIDVLEKEIPQNKWLEYIKAENVRMGQLVKGLLYLAQNDIGRFEYTVFPFDLAAASAYAVLPFESIAFEQGKTLNISIPHTKIPAEGDESKIKQAIIILMDNALKNSERGAVISVTVGQSGGKGFVQVHNTGRGIKEEDMEKIFNRFYRVDTSRDRKTGGYGLGLSIAQSIAEVHHGKITVESEEGKYAQFTLSIPLSFPRHR